MSSNIDAQAKVFRQIRTLVDVHDGDVEPVAPFSKCSAGLKAQGIMMAWADIERLGWEEGDVVYPSKDLRLSSGGMYKQIRVICECQKMTAEDVVEHDVPVDVNADDDADSISTERKRELVTV